MLGIITMIMTITMIMLNMGFSSRIWVEENLKYTAPYSVSVSGVEPGDPTSEVINILEAVSYTHLHAGHELVEDALVEKICTRVNDGMGLVVLHSGHHSKIFRRMTGTNCNLRWREEGERCEISTVLPTHPIAKGVPQMFDLDHEEMYGEPFVIPNPDEVVFISWFQGGNVFRSGVTYHRGNGKIFYFQPGHETYRSYYNENVLKVIHNAINWTYNPDAANIPCVWEPVSYTHLDVYKRQSVSFI